MSIEWLAFQLREKLVTLKNTRLSKEDLDHKNKFSFPLSGLMTKFRDFKDVFDIVASTVIYFL